MKRVKCIGDCREDVLCSASTVAGVKSFRPVVQQCSSCAHLQRDARLIEGSLKHSVYSNATSIICECGGIELSLEGQMR